MKNKILILLQIYLALSFVSAWDCDGNQIINLTRNNTDYGCLDNPQECQNLLSIDEKSCIFGCESGEYISQQSGFLQCKICDEQIFLLEGQQDQYCGQTCPDGYFYIEEDNSQFCRRSNCTENQILDHTQKRCLNSPKECENLLSIDGKSCIFGCESGEYISKQSDYLQCKICGQRVFLLEGQQNQHCGYNCPDDYFYIKEDNSQFCRKCTENQILDQSQRRQKRCLNSPQECEKVISIDGKSCISYCPDGQYEAQLSGYQQCKICDQDVFEFLIEKGQHCGYSCPNNYDNIDTNKCIKNCYKKNYLDYEYWDHCIEKMDCLFVSEDNPNQCLKDMNLCKGYFYEGVCLKSCPKGTYTSKNFDKIYGYCVKDCKRNKYLDENGKIWCSDKCPNGLISNGYTNVREIQICIKPQDCKDFVNYEQNFCVDSCEGQPFEEINGYKLCLKRERFYIRDGETNRYFDKCPDGYATNIDYNANQCIPKSDCKITQYDNLYLSGDEKFCSRYCRLPEVATPDGKCINFCKNKPSCESRCPEGLYEDEIYSHINGIFCRKSCSLGFISSDGKKCVQECSNILEINPGKYEKIKKCKKCPQGQYPILNDDNLIECRLQSQQQIQEQRFKYLKDLSKIYVQHQYETYLLMLKEYINYYLSIHKDSYTAMLDVLSITTQLLDDNFYGGMWVYSQVIESKEKDYKIVYEQSPDNQYKMKNNFNVEKLSQLTYYGVAKYITEADSENSFIIMTILNPFCKINQCQGSKLFILKKGSLIQDRKPDLSQIFEVTFNVDPYITLKEKITCVTYDNDGNISPLKTILSQEQSTVTCSFQLVQSNAAYIFDENCQFVNQSLCSTTKKSLPNPNSTSKGENSLRGGNKN